MIPRNYQKRLVSNVKKALETKGNTIAVAPTGAGKTIMLSMTIGAMQPAKTLIIQHRDELVSQNLLKFRQVNPKVSTGLYTAETKSWRALATFGMVQTLCRKQNLSTIPKLDLLVIDESHHAIAKTYQDIISTAKDRNPELMIAGFTATPQRGDKKGLRSVFDNVADVITLRELITGGFLVPPKAYVVSVGTVHEDLAKVRQVGGEFDMDEVASILNVKVVNEEVLRQWKEKAGDRKTIIFCSTLDHAAKVTSTFVEDGIAAEMISGDLPANERASILKRFKTGKTQVVVNVAVLTEGFDEPSISCVVLLRPCSYKSTMIQMIGRGLRTINPEEYPGLIKKDCFVIDFGISIKTHGDIHAEIDLDGKEKGEGPEKVCPLEDGGCGVSVPMGVKFCPICGFEFPERDLGGILDQEIATEVALNEFDLLDKSPFYWCDLFGSDKVLIASGFDAWAGVMSPDGENWFAIGRDNTSRRIHRLFIGERINALAAADDFLRVRETSEGANKGKRWLKDQPSEKQLEHLRRVGYDVGPFDFSFNKYTAACHLNFQWNRRQLEAAIFNR